MRTIIFITFTVLLLTGSVPVAPEIDARPERPFVGGPFTRSEAVTVTLSYTDLSGEPSVVARFRNNLERPICVKQSALGGSLARPAHLYIRNSIGVIEFIESGVHIVRQGYACHVLDAGRELSVTYTLLDNFRFPDNKDRYTAFYYGPGFPFYDPPEDEPRSALESDTITFELDNRPFWKKWFN